MIVARFHHRVIRREGHSLCRGIVAIGTSVMAASAAAPAAAAASLAVAAFGFALRLPVGGFFFAEIDRGLLLRLRVNGVL